MTGRGLAGLTTESLGRHYVRLDTVGSTNDYLRERADSLPHGAAVTAERQTGGKGRRGKSWQAAPGDCLALSVLLKIKGFSARELGVLPLVAGVAAADAIYGVSGARCGLKWSNDVLIGDKKVSGILCESRVGGEEADAFAVAGIGINLRQSAGEFNRLGLSYAASLFSVTGKAPEEEAVAAAVLNHLEGCLRVCQEQGFGALLPRYRALCVNLGRPVRVSIGGGEREGVAVDITPSGALVCEIGGARVEISSGESSVRGIYGYI